MSNLRWKLDRLRAMGMAEIAHRVRETAKARTGQAGLGLAKPTRADLSMFGKPWVEKFPEQVNARICLDAADHVLSGRWPVFDQPFMELGFPPIWNRDPKTGAQAPMSFGKTLDFRRADLVGDIKFLWEPNRHLELTLLAQAWRLSKDVRYLDGIRTYLESWFDQCPYPLGPNWASSLELAVRLFNWAACWHLIGGVQSPLFEGAPGEMFRQRWLDSVFRHCHFIRGYLSRHSSANNHLFGELSGLFIASITWPCWKTSEDWRNFARIQLEIEALAQNTTDGVNREQAFWYQHEVMDMMLLVLLHGKANGFGFSRAFEQRLESMMDFICAAMDAGGNVPAAGDGDDAVMVRFDRSPDFEPFHSLLAVGAVLFNRPDFAKKAGVFDDKARWLLGDQASKTFDEQIFRAGLENRNTFRREYPEGGYWILGRDFGTANEIHLMADAGPLGYLSIAAHGHADALAFTLSVGGVPLLIDPGTFSYHAAPPWRDYFRGTSAHNTLRVDGQDQSVAAGKFLWLRHAGAHCLHWESMPDKDIWIAEHDGYQRLNDPVIHRRRIELDKQSRRISVTDELVCQGEHQVEMFLHFNEAWVVAGNGRMFTASLENRVVQIELDGTLRGDVVAGSDTAPAGWLSRKYGEKTACPTLIAQCHIHGTSRFRTVIDLAGAIAA